MKILRLLLILFCLNAAAQTNVIYFRVGDIMSGSGNPNVRGLKTVLTDTTENPRVINGVFVNPAPVTRNTGSDSKVYFTNVVWGTYSWTLYSSPQVSFDIQVETNTTGVVDGATLTSITNQPNPLSEFYTKVQVDALFTDFSGGVSLEQLLSTSNSLQSQITSGGATTLVVTSIVNSATGVITKNVADLTFKFSSTGTNNIQAIAQPLVNTASNTLALSSAALGANLTNDVNTTSNSLVGTSQTIANTSSNAVLGNAQTAINTTSNSLAGTSQTIVNSSSNALAGTMQASVNATSNLLNGSINTSSNSIVTNLPPRGNYVALTNTVTGVIGNVLMSTAHLDTNSSPAAIWTNLQPFNLEFHVLTNAFTNVVTCEIGPLTNKDGYVFWLFGGTNQ